MRNFCVVVGPGSLPKSCQQSLASVVTDRSHVSSGVWRRHGYWFRFLTRKNKGQGTGWLSAFVGSEGESQICWRLPTLMRSHRQRQTQGGQPCLFSVLFQGDGWRACVAQQRQAGVPLTPRAEAGVKDPLETPVMGVTYLKNPHILTREGVSFLPREQDTLSGNLKPKPSSSQCVSSCASVPSPPLPPRH